MAPVAALALRTDVAQAVSIDGLAVAVGGLTRAELVDRLRGRGVGLNAHAETLLAHPVFDGSASARTVVFAERSVAELGFPEGAGLSRILAAARQRGLLLCPLDTAPYLRLALLGQSGSTDSALSVGRAPHGSLTVASEPISADDEYPKGFYLRVVDGQPWLRGYRCDDEHRWAPEDRMVFATA